MTIEVFGRSFESLRTREFAALTGIFFILGILRELFLGSIGFGSLGTIVSNSLTVTNLSVSLPMAFNMLALGLTSLATLPLTVIAIKSLQGKQILSTVNMVTIKQSILLVVIGALVTVSVIIGTLFLIIPGIFLAASFFLFPVYISKGYGVKSLRKSWESSRDKRLNICAIMLISVIITSLPHVLLMLIGGEYTVILLNSIEVVLGISIMVNTFECVEDMEGGAL